VGRRWKIRVAVLVALVAVMAMGVVYTLSTPGRRLVTADEASLVHGGMTEDEAAAAFGSPGRPVEFVIDPETGRYRPVGNFDGSLTYPASFMSDPAMMVRQWEGDGVVWFLEFRNGRVSAKSWLSHPRLEKASRLDRAAGSVRAKRLTGWR